MFISNRAYDVIILIHGLMVYFVGKKEGHYLCSYGIIATVPSVNSRRKFNVMFNTLLKVGFLHTL